MVLHRPVLIHSADDEFLDLNHIGIQLTQCVDEHIDAARARYLRRRVRSQVTSSHINSPRHGQVRERRAPPTQCAAAGTRSPARTPSPKGSVHSARSRSPSPPGLERTVPEPHYAPYRNMRAAAHITGEDAITRDAPPEWW